MLYALDPTGKKTFIRNSRNDVPYICPICHGTMIRKWGSQRTPHFAHMHAVCDLWYTENKSAWHRNMQAHFQPSQCEVRLDSDDGSFHIADVFIPGTVRNLVIEFQHSPISMEEFDSRNEFYSTARCVVDADGRKWKNQVIWVFDCRERPMYVGLGDTETTFSTVSVDSDRMCQDYLCSSYYRHRYARFAPGSRTQLDLAPKTGMYANTIWKRPLRIFRHAGDNIFIYFDVHQRKYIESERENWSGYRSESMQYLADLDTEAKRFDDGMYDFLICAEEPRTFLPRNYSLAIHPDRFIGRVVMYQDFFDCYAKS